MPGCDGAVPIPPQTGKAWRSCTKLDLDSPLPLWERGAGGVRASMRVSVQRVVAVAAEAVAVAVSVVIPMVMAAARWSGMLRVIGAGRRAARAGKGGEQAARRLSTGGAGGILTAARGAEELLEGIRASVAAILVDRHVSTIRGK